MCTSIGDTLRIYIGIFFIPSNNRIPVIIMNTSVPIPLCGLFSVWNMLFKFLCIPIIHCRSKRKSCIRSSPHLIHTDSIDADRISDWLLVMCVKLHVFCQWIDGIVRLIIQKIFRSCIRIRIPPQKLLVLQDGFFINSVDKFSRR